MSDQTISTALVEKAFGSLRADPGRGNSWMDREAADNHSRAARFIAHSAADVVINVAMEAVSALKPGQTGGGVHADYRLELCETDMERLSVLISDRTGAGEWTVNRSTGRHGSRFEIRQRHNDGSSSVLASGEWSRASTSVKPLPARYHVVNSYLGSAALHQMLRLASAVRPDVKFPTPIRGFASEPAIPVLEADGWVPGANCRKLYRLLYEESARRVCAWAGPLFDETARLYAAEGAWWGSRAVAWTYDQDARFPKFEAPKIFACLLPRSGRATTAAAFRDARPYLETETYIVWRETAPGGAPGVLNLLPVNDPAAEDIEEFIASGGVPAISYDPENAEIRVTEKAMASNVLETFARHAGEAWSVLRDAPLYGSRDDRRMFTDDFGAFDRIEPWTRRGKAIARESEASMRLTEKSPRP